MQSNFYKGLIKDLSNDLYHSDRTHYSSSVLKTAMSNPKEFYDVYVLGKEKPQGNDTALLIGNYMHCALLEPEKLWDEFIVFDGTRRGKAYDLAMTAAQGKPVLGKSQYDTCMEMLQGFNNTKIQLGENYSVEAATLFQGGIAESSLFMPSFQGLPIKVRPDYMIIGDKEIICRDLKTTSDQANTVEQARSIVNDWDYDLSAALYKDVLQEYYSKPVVFEWVFISKDDFNTNVYRLSENTYQKGKEKYIKGIAKIKEIVYDKNISSLFGVREL